MNKLEKKITEDIEFYIPEKGLDLDLYLSESLHIDAKPKEKRLRKQAIHHLARYYWAIEVLKDGNYKGRKLLDVACGAGYGSYLLAKALPDIDVVGGDYDPRSREYATKNYEKLPNLSFSTLDMIAWENADGSAIGEFDIITSFDTLEHLLFREIALINIAENLQDDGVLLFSTPSGSRKNKLNPGWEHHKIEYSYNYLINLMKRFFHEVYLPDDGDLPMFNFWKNKINLNSIEYLTKGNPIFARKPIKHSFRDLIIL